MAPTQSKFVTKHPWTTVTPKKKTQKGNKKATMTTNPKTSNEAITAPTENQATKAQTQTKKTNPIKKPTQNQAEEETIHEDTEINEQEEPKITETLRLEIRAPQGQIKSFNEETAFENFANHLIGTLEQVEIASENGDKPIITLEDVDQAPVQNYYKGKMGKPEHGHAQYIMECIIRYPEGQDFYKDIKGPQLPFLNRTNSWLERNIFDSLDIAGAGFFTLKQPHWTDLDRFRDQILDNLQEQINALDPEDLTHEQQDSIDIFMENKTMPHVELIRQKIRTFLPEEEEEEEDKAEDEEEEAMEENEPDHEEEEEEVKETPKKQWINAWAIELRCELKYHPAMKVLLEAIANKTLWKLGRYISYLLKSDQALYAAFVQEQEQFLTSTQFIQVRRAPETVLRSNILFEQTQNFGQQGPYNIRR